MTWTDVTPTNAQTSSNQNRSKYIEVDDQDPNKIWCILMGSQTGNKVFQSTDGGATWTNLTTPTIASNVVFTLNNEFSFAE